MTKNKNIFFALSSFCFCFLLLKAAGYFLPTDNRIIYACIHFILYIAAFIVPFVFLNKYTYFAPKKATVLHYIILPICVFATVMLVSHIFGTSTIEENKEIPIILAVKSALIAPILEELFFRKGLCKALSKYGFVVSLILSSLLFALIHSDLCSVVYSFISGLILAYAYLSTGSVILCIFAHILNNAAFIVLPYILGV